MVEDLAPGDPSPVGSIGGGRSSREYQELMAAWPMLAFGEVQDFTRAATSRSRRLSKGRHGRLLDVHGPGRAHRRN